MPPRAIGVSCPAMSNRISREERGVAVGRARKTYSPPACEAAAYPEFRVCQRFRQRAIPAAIHHQARAPGFLHVLLYDRPCENTPVRAVRPRPPARGRAPARNLKSREQSRGRSDDRRKAYGYRVSRKGNFLFPEWHPRVEADCQEMEHRGTFNFERSGHGDPFDVRSSMFLGSAREGTGEGWFCRMPESGLLGAFVFQHPTPATCSRRNHGKPNYIGLGAAAMVRIDPLRGPLDSAVTTARQRGCLCRFPGGARDTTCGLPPFVSPCTLPARF